MRKIISLFQRNHDGDRLVRNEVTPGAEWVVSGEGDATRKFDGTCCMVRDGRLYKRYDLRKGKQPPSGFEPAQPEADPVTGHWPGWLAVGDGADDAWHREAWGNWRGGHANALPPDGTYELIGPKVQGNPEGAEWHRLIRHGDFLETDAPRDFEGLRSYLRHGGIEGIVWHHPDGRMVKIKAKDFGVDRWPF